MPASTSWWSPRARSPAACTCSRCRCGPSAIEELQAASAVGQGRLYRTYDELLRERGIQSAQVLLTFFDMSARTHYLNARRTLRKLLEWRIVPVINENDTTTTDEISFGDNDFLAAQVAVLVGASCCVLLTDTGGLYTADPRRTRGARLVREVTDSETLDALRSATRSRRSARAGCARRSSAAEMATAAGIPTVIGSGFEPGVLARALGGGGGGHALRAAAGAASRASSSGCGTPSPRAGTVTVDAGAARALRDGGTSLLPVGIVDVRGDFDAGDAVEVCGRRRARRDRQGDLQLLRRRAAPVHGDEVRRRCARCSRAPPRRPCTATTSCSS